MKAEIFYYGEEQQSIATMLNGFLKQYINPFLCPVLHDISASDSKEIVEFGQRYVKLLQASIPPNKGVRISVKDASSFYQGYCFYILVYYPFSHTERQFDKDRLKVFFPALQIHDQMILVPQGLGNILDPDKQNINFFKPLEMGGIQEIDYSNDIVLNDTIKSVSKMLRDEIFTEIRAYSKYNKFNDVNLQKIANDLDIDLTYINFNLNSTEIKQAFYNDLSCVFSEQNIKLNIWTKTNLIISNNSASDINDIIIEISGPAKFLPTRIQTSIPEHTKKEIPISIMSEDQGDFPLEIVFTLPEDKIFADWLPVHHIWLHCD